MTKRILVLSTGLALLLIAVLACGGETGAETAEPEMVLRAYDVPSGYENEIRSTLANALLGGSDEKRVGRAQLGPDGKLVVVAPQGVQRGIAGFIAQLGDLDSPPPAPRAVSLKYWLVVSRALDPSKRSAAAERGYVISGANPLQELQPALKKIAASQGAAEFRLLEQLQLTSMGDNDWSSTTGRVVSVDQRVSTLPDAVVAEIKIRMIPRPMTGARNQVESRVTLRPGQFLVLGQTGFAGQAGDAFGEEDGDTTLYYVLTSDPQS